MGTHRSRKTLSPVGDGMAQLVQLKTQGAHPVDAQGVDRIRRQRQRQKLIGFLLVTVEQALSRRFGLVASLAVQ
jgi:hypothetical protein